MSQRFEGPNLRTIELAESFLKAKGYRQMQSYPKRPSSFVKFVSDRTVFFHIHFEDGKEVCWMYDMNSRLFKGLEHNADRHPRDIAV